MPIEEIHIEPAETPVCVCGCDKWIVRQRIERESGLQRVDKFSDLIVEKPEPNTYQQSVLLECLDCSATYQPQSGVWGKVDAYVEGSEAKDEATGQVIESLSGQEDGFGWPNQIQNIVGYEEGEFGSGY